MIEDRENAFPPGTRVYHHNHRYASAYVHGSGTIVGIGDFNDRFFDYEVDVDGLSGAPSRRTMWPSGLTYKADEQPILDSNSDSGMTCPGHQYDDYSGAWECFCDDDCECNQDITNNNSHEGKA